MSYKQSMFNYCNCMLTVNKIILFNGKSKIFYKEVISMKKLLSKPSKKINSNLVMLYAVEGGTNHNGCNAVAGC